MLQIDIAPNNYFVSENASIEKGFLLHRIHRYLQQ